jgi:DNA polymerase III subunit delta
MKLPPQRVAGFLKAPDGGMRAALIYGPDGGLVKERATLLARAICSDLSDAFRVAELEGDTIARDPARLYDECASLNLLGGRRLVRVREVGDAAGAAFDRLFKDLPPGDSFIVVEAGDLAPRSALRRVFEAAKAAVAIACYLDGPRELGELVRETLGAHRITVATEASHYLVAHLGGDRGISRQELEKLALYAGDGAAVDLAAAQACVGDSAELTIDEVVFAAAEGDAAQLERALNRAFSEGAQPVTIVRAELRHFQRLHLAAARRDAGKSEEEALRFRPPLFFKLLDRFKRQLRLWPASRAAAALVALNEAEAQMKTTGLPAETICRNALLAIARAARVAAR